MIPNGYIRVSRRQPCPICNRRDGCLLSKDGAYAGCFRVQDGCDRNAVGQPILLCREFPTWRHTIQESRRSLPKVWTPAKDSTGVDIDWNNVHGQLVLDADAGQLTKHSMDIGLSVDSLQQLGIGWSKAAKAWSFPMRDDKLRIIGIRLRRPDGVKFAVSGSRNGLFIPISGYASRVLIEEGPTSTAALLDLGFSAIGRPSCSACVDMTARLCKGTDAVIVANHDEEKRRPDGTSYFPGQDGAEILADALRATARSVKIIEPLGAKDSRDWKKNGVTRETVLDVISMASKWRGKR